MLIILWNIRFKYVAVSRQSNEKAKNLQLPTMPACSVNYTKNSPLVAATRQQQYGFNGTIGIKRSSLSIAVNGKMAP
ncbi:MAG TPA: hypothetical protein H9675_07065 [Firmicutes bacterium]|nr:hypothetical protein [Bacillota bacterium]